MSTVLIIGASRGIGLELARQYIADGARVMATHRRDDDAARIRALGARPVALDVLDGDACAALAKPFQNEKIDIAIINAGIPGPRSAGLEVPTIEEFDTVMQTHVLAAMRLIPVLAPSLIAAQGKLAVLSSGLGSLARTTQAFSWLYRASKAALNMTLRAASAELGPKGVVCMAFSPGWVRTDMGGPGAELDVATSVAGLRKVIAAANASHNGKFISYTGQQIEW